MVGTTRRGDKNSAGNRRTGCGRGIVNRIHRRTFTCSSGGLENVGLFIG